MQTHAPLEPEPGEQIGRVPLQLRPLPPRPLVSVLMSNYNYAAYIGQAIESVQRQTWDNLELVICDDGSTDGSREIIEKYAAADPRISTIFKRNGGQPSGWNAAWPLCNGSVICILDADDTFAPDKLETVVAAMHRDPGAGLLVHALTVTDQDGGAVQRMPFMTHFERGFIAEAVLRRGGRWRYMPSSALCLRREVAEFAFPIPEDLFVGHADSMVVGMAPLVAPVAALDAALGTYRVHGRNTMGGDFRDLASARKVVRCTGEMVRGVNARLAQLGAPVRLNATKNLELMQAQFVESLLDRTEFSRLWPEFRRLARALAADDLYSRSQKVLGAAAYCVAMLLPGFLRERFLHTVLGYSRLKRFAQAVAAALRSTFRRRPAAAAETVPVAELA